MSTLRRTTMGRLSRVTGRWRVGMIPTNYEQALQTLDWLCARLGPVECARQVRAAYARRRTVPHAERVAVARELEARLDGVRVAAPAPNASSLMDNWRAAGRRLTGANWRTWNRIDQRLDGWGAMMLSREDKAFVRGCMADGGEHLVDPDRR